MPLHVARAERAALCDTLEAVGPDAPTLCSGWTAADLAAHLYLREHRPDAGLGVVIRPLAGHTERVQTGLKDRYGWPGIVEKLRAGPPAAPFAVPGLDDAMNTMEYFVHHEDVRRARDGWEPRVLPAELASSLRARVRGLSLLFRRVRGVEVVLVTPDGARSRVRRGPADSTVTISGEPPELTLYAFGRQSVAEVVLDGPPASVDALATAPLGL